MVIERWTSVDLKTDTMASTRALVWFRYLQYWQCFDALMGWCHVTELSPMSQSSASWDPYTRSHHAVYVTYTGFWCNILPDTDDFPQPASSTPMIMFPHTRIAPTSHIFVEWVCEACRPVQQCWVATCRKRLVFQTPAMVVIKRNDGKYLGHCRRWS